MGVGKRSREVLAPEYIGRYSTEILDRVNLEALALTLPRERSSALLCVEREPQACHRSLIAARLAERGMARVFHLLPGE